MAKTDYLIINLAGRSVRLALELWGDEAVETWLLLPALSTVSSRSEWHRLPNQSTNRFNWSASVAWLWRQ